MHPAAPFQRGLRECQLHDVYTGKVEWMKIIVHIAGRLWKSNQKRKLLRSREAWWLHKESDSCFYRGSHMTSTGPDLLHNKLDLDLRCD